MRQRLSPRGGIVAQLSYRQQERDERGGTRIPNTGGKWLDVVVGAQYNATDNLSAHANLTRPVWRDLNDALQFTTSYAYSVSLSMSY